MRRSGSIDDWRTAPAVRLSPDTGPSDKLDAAPSIQISSDLAKACFFATVEGSVDAAPLGDRAVCFLVDGLVTADCAARRVSGRRCHRPMMAGEDGLS